MGDLTRKGKYRRAVQSEVKWTKEQLGKQRAKCVSFSFPPLLLRPSSVCVSAFLSRSFIVACALANGYSFRHLAAYLHMVFMMMVGFGRLALGAFFSSFSPSFSLSFVFFLSFPVLLSLSPLCFLCSFHRVEHLTFVSRLCCGGSHCLSS